MSEYIYPSYIYPSYPHPDALPLLADIAEARAELKLGEDAGNQERMDAAQRRLRQLDARSDELDDQGRLLIPGYPIVRLPEARG